MLTGRMRSLFLKVFLWFWLAMVLIVGALVVTSYLTRSERGPRPPQFVAGVMWVYTQSAVASYERGGAEALTEFLNHAERDAGIRARLFDAEGRELSGRAAAAEEQEVAAEAVRTARPATRRSGSLIYEAQPAPARGQPRYVFVAAFPFGPAGPPEFAGAGTPPRPPGPPGLLNFIRGDSTSAFVARVVVVVLTAGALCYLLALYLVSPVGKLRALTRQLAGGDLSARVGPLLGRRRDELAELGHDFDAMAARIEALLGAQGRLLRDISHELRSPLARLSVALDLARKRAGPDAAGHLARIEREAERLNEMIGQLLSLSRWETGAEGARRQRIDLAALVREVAEDADFEARVSDRSVVLEVCDACEIEGTPTLLRSAFENVVRNAVRHTPEATSVKVSLNCKRADGQLILRVRDEGAGVPEEMLADIFRPFYRVDDSRTRETGGAGLGLAITERAVRLHGGTVTAANVQGGGFVVEIHLPLDSLAQQD